MSAPSAPPTPSFAEEAVAPAGHTDPLSGDWSEGLPGPRRAHGIPQPKRIALNGHAEPAQPPAPAILDAEEVLRMQFGEAPAPAEPPPAFDDLTPPSPAPAFEAASPVADVAPSDATLTPPSPEAESAPTPWSEPVAATPAGSDVAWDAPAPAEPIVEIPAAAPVGEPLPALESATAAPQDDSWSAAPAEPPAPAPDETWTAPAAQPVDEWQAEAPATGFEEVRAPEPEAAPAAPAAAADWTSLRSGPDWSAPATPAGAPVESWGAPPPAPAASEWSPAPAAAEPEWSLAAAEPPPAPEWSAPAAPPPSPAAAWNSPAVGASALEQLESEPPAPDPSAAKELFGTVPSGGMLAGDDEDGVGPPEELASPEEVLRPLPIDHDDPDLPAAMAEPQKPAPRPQPLAAFRPPSQGALEIHGEHRVAVHTRGGRTLRGTVENIDLSKPQFPLAPQGGGETEAIYHSEVKAIFFMLAPGERTNGGDGAKVRVTFADGRVIEGVREGAEAKHGFFLVPSDAARTNTRRIYVAREATSEIKDG